MWPFLLITLVAVFYAWVKWKYTYWSRRGVPNPEPTFLVGNIWPSLSFKEHIGMLSYKWYSEFKDVPYFGYYKLLEPSIILKDPDLIKDVLVKDCANFHANDFPINEKNDPLMATNPFATQGDIWKRGRSLLVPMFTANKVKTVYPEMESACSKFSNYLKSQPAGKDLNAKSISAKFTTENVIKCSFSLEAGCFEPGFNEFRDIGKRMLQPSFTVGFKFLVTPLLPKWLARLIPIPMLPTVVDAWFRQLIKENKKSRENLQVERDDFLQTLLNTTEKSDTSDVELAGHSMSLFLEGFETSSTVLSFALFELARNPECQQRLYEEVTAVLEKHNHQFKFEALQEMTYLECVVAESLRLNPVMIQMQKLCTEEYTLPKFGDQKEGVKVYPGTSVIIPVRAIHLDADLYPEPEVFNPDRFTDEEKRLRHKAHYVPFGEGPRMCMGMRFGLTQVKAAIMTVIKDFEVKVSPNHKPMEVDPQSMLWQAKDGLLLNFERRQA